MHIRRHGNHRLRVVADRCQGHGGGMRGWSPGQPRITATRTACGRRWCYATAPKRVSAGHAWRLEAAGGRRTQGLEEWQIKGETVWATRAFPAQPDPRRQHHDLPKGGWDGRGVGTGASTRSHAPSRASSARGMGRIPPRRRLARAQKCNIPDAQKCNIFRCPLTRWRPTSLVFGKFECRVAPPAKVFWVPEAADQGAGRPDFALYTARQVPRGSPRQGQVPERRVVGRRLVDCAL